MRNFVSHRQHQYRPKLTQKILKNLYILLFINILAINILNAQSIKTDSNYVLNINDLYQIILDEHPLSQKARLLPKQAQNMLMMAKGGFDPTVAADFSSKTFKDKNYWTYRDAYLKIPTWIGADLKLAFEDNGGDLLDGSNQTPNSGLNYVGFAIPLGRGLVIDQRRAALKQARFFENQSEAEQNADLNKLLLQATKDYSAWYVAYQSFVFLDDAYNLASQRDEFVRQRVLLGDAAPIDSVEAVLATQQRLLERNTVLLDLENRRLMVSNYLWADDVPLQIQSNVVPIRNIENLGLIAQDSLQRAIDFAQRFHPNIEKINFKGKILDIDRRLAREMLKPEINIDAGILQQNSAFSVGIDRGFIADNYKIGASVYIPIFLRKERGKLGLSQLKVIDNGLDFIFEQQLIGNEVRMAYNQIKNLEQQLALSQVMVSNYTILRDGEKTRFDNGESSVFLINAREAKLVEARIKNADIESKLIKAVAEWRFSIGLF